MDLPQVKAGTSGEEGLNDAFNTFDREVQRNKRFHSDYFLKLMTALAPFCDVRR